MSRRRTGTPSGTADHLITREKIFWMGYGSSRQPRILSQPCRGVRLSNSNLSRHQLAEINYTLIDNNISKNFGGISQYSRDIRSSNNLYHWTFANCSITENQGGIQLRLPYVLQYNENFTHSIVFDNNVYRENK